jgi:hypothetical protein
MMILNGRYYFLLPLLLVAACDGTEENSPTPAQSTFSEAKTGEVRIEHPVSDQPAASNTIAVVAPPALAAEAGIDTPAVNIATTQPYTADKPSLEAEVEHGAKEPAVAPDAEPRSEQGLASKLPATVEPVVAGAEASQVLVAQPANADNAVAEKESPLAESKAQLENSGKTLAARREDLCK